MLFHCAIESRNKGHLNVSICLHIYIDNAQPGNGVYGYWASIYEIVMVLVQPNPCLCACGIYGFPFMPDLLNIKYGLSDITGLTCALSTKEIYVSGLCDVDPVFV